MHGLNIIWSESSRCTIYDLNLVASLWTELGIHGQNPWTELGCRSIYKFYIYNVKQDAVGYYLWSIVFYLLHYLRSESCCCTFYGLKMVAALSIAWISLLKPYGLNHAALSMVYKRLLARCTIYVWNQTQIESNPNPSWTQSELNRNQTETKPNSKSPIQSKIFEPNPRITELEPNSANQSMFIPSRPV